MQVQALPVSSCGEIFVPYVGQFYVPAMTWDEARQSVQYKLFDIAHSAHVQLASGTSNSVDPVGGLG